MTLPLILALAMSPDAAAYDDIINGDSVSQSTYPETGGLLVGATISFDGFEYEFKMLMCSATLIAPDVVLLAAHCVDFDYFEAMAGLELSEVEVVFSRQSDLSAYTGMPQEWPSDAVFAWDAVSHEGFSMDAIGMGLSENDDIGLLFLEEAIDDVSPAVVVTSDEADAIVEGAVVDIVGWGQQTSDQTPPTGTVGIKMGGQSVIGEVADFEFQVGPNDSDVRKCHGDSGGPTFMEIDGGVRIIGVTSHAYDMTDCRRTGGVDTRVDYYLDWIDNEMRARCESGERVWCDEEGILGPGSGAGGNLTLDEGTESGALSVSLGDDNEGGCSCSSMPDRGSLAWLTVLLGVIGLRRR